MNNKNERAGGFTLLELLIVISIIAILSVALVLVLNPAEALKKSRDAQRISDLSTMKTALGLYMTSTSSPRLDGGTNTLCEATLGTPTNIYYSLPVTGGSITMALPSSATPHQRADAATATLTSGAGWIPVDFDSLTGGSPISNLPLDPTNSFVGTETVAGFTNASLFYRYACANVPFTFEINARLESTAYTTGADNKMITDGGNSDNLYEVGTNLKVLPGTAVTNF